MKTEALLASTVHRQHCCLQQAVQEPENGFRYEFNHVSVTKQSLIIVTLHDLKSLKVHMQLCNCNRQCTAYKMKSSTRRHMEFAAEFNYPEIVIVTELSGHAHVLAVSFRHR